MIYKLFDKNYLRIQLTSKNIYHFEKINSLSWKITKIFNYLNYINSLYKIQLRDVIPRVRRNFCF